MTLADPKCPKASKTDFWLYKWRHSGSFCVFDCAQILCRRQKWNTSLRYIIIYLGATIAVAVGCCC